MAGALHTKPVHYLSGKLQNFRKERDRKVRFEEGEKAANAALKSGVGGKSRLTLDGGFILKDKQTGELPPFGEHIPPVQPQPKDLGTIQESEEVRLKGKLKWLFEQDRMFWESNSARNSRQGSPEVELSKGLGAAFTTLAEYNETRGRANIHTSESSETEIAKVVPFGDVSWSSPNANLACREENPKKSKSPAGDTSVCHASIVPEVFSTPTVEPKQNMAFMSSLDLGGEEFFTDNEDYPTDSGDSSSECVLGSSDDNREGKRINATGGGGAVSVKELKSQASFLKAKCTVLSKEKDRAVRKWKRSCLEIDQAAKMAVSLRSAIETLLETSAGDSNTDFESKQENLGDQTLALKARMEKLRRKSSEGGRRRSETRRRGRSSEHRGKVEMMKKASDLESLASPEIPRGTEHNVEALRARLEKLMLITNSRVTEEKGQVRVKSHHAKKPPVGIFDKKSHLNETSELKLKGWFNSLSAELSPEPQDGLMGGCDKCGVPNGRLGLGEVGSVDTPYMSKHGTPSASKTPTPVTSKQVSPLHPMHDRDGSGSTPSSEETKKKVIHKIAEEVRLEGEQWFQVQDLLQRVGEDMKSLQEACDTWEKRAIRAEAQVSCMHHEGQEKKEKAIQLGDEKVAELQKEMSRLKDTVEEVRKQLGGINIDPSGWFEAASRFGYAFMPVNLHSPHTSVPCRGPSEREPSDLQRHNGPAVMDDSKPSSSTNSAAAALNSFSREKQTHALNDSRRRSQVPSKQWASEIAKAEEEEILTQSTTSGQASKLVFVNSMKEELFPVSNGKLKEKHGNVSRREPGLEGSDSRDLVLQMQPTGRERCNVLNQEEQFSRNSSFNNSLRRSPLRDVVENITSSKENKRPL